MLIEGCLPLTLLVFLFCRQHMVKADEEHFANDPRRLTEQTGPAFDDFEPDVYDDDEFHFKRALDYGHFRFGKRAPRRPAGDKRSPDYGHLKFGRRSPDYGHMKFGRRSPDYGHMKFGRRSLDYGFLKFGRRSPDYGQMKVGNRQPAPRSRRS